MASTGGRSPRRTPPNRALESRTVGKRKCAAMHEPSTARFAIYYVPDPATPLARFACSWLGRDVEDGGAVTPLVVEGLDGARQAALTADPRLYGFHATLKPPFRLAAAGSATALLDAVAAYAATTMPVRITALRLATLGHFMA